MELTAAEDHQVQLEMDNGGGRAAVLLIALLLQASQLAALDPQRAVHQYLQVSWQVEDGLPQNGVFKYCSSSSRISSRFSCVSGTGSSSNCDR